MWLTDKIIHILSSIIPEYKIEHQILGKKESCHCKSGDLYWHCCHDRDTQKNVKAVIVIKTNIRTNNSKQTVKLFPLPRRGILHVKKGDINPLNKRGDYQNNGIDFDC